MSWTKTAASVAVWGAISVSASTWTSATRPRTTWQQLVPIPDAADEADFTMRVNDTYPLRVVDAHPNYVIDRSERP